jgi:hypothetical protein
MIGLRITWLPRFLAILAVCMTLVSSYGDTAEPIFAEGSGVSIGETFRVDLASMVPSSAGLVAPLRFAFSGAKPAWVTLNGSTLNAAPPLGQVTVGLPVWLNFTVTDSATTPVVNTGTYMMIPVTAQPCFVAGLGTVAGGVAEMDLSAKVPGSTGLVPPYRFAVTGTKPDWVTLDGGVLRIAPPQGSAASVAPIAIGLTVTDSAELPSVRVARANVGVVVLTQAQRIEGKVAVGFAEGTTDRVDVGVTGLFPSVGWGGVSLRAVPSETNSTVAVYELVALPPVGPVAQTVSTLRAGVSVEVTPGLKRVAILTKAGRTEVSLPSAVPLFQSSLTVVAGGTASVVDLAGLARAVQGSDLIEPYRFSVEGELPAWMVLEGGVLRVAPAADEGVRAEPFRVKLRVEDASAVTIFRDATVDVQVNAAPPGPTLVQRVEGDLLVRYAEGSSKRLELEVVGQVPTGGWGEAVLRRVAGASTPDVAVYEFIGLPPAGVAAQVISTLKAKTLIEVTPALRRVAVVTKAGRMEVAVPAAPPLFTTSVSVIAGGSAATLDLRTQAKAVAGVVLVEPLKISLEGSVPAWVSLTGSVMKFSPSEAVAASATPIRVGVKVTDSASSPESRNAWIDIRVTALPVVPPTILKQPVGGMLSAAGTFTLSVSAVGKSGLKYAWMKEGKVVAGAVSPIFIAREAGSYSVSISDAKSAVTSSIVTVRGMPPVIVKQPVSGNLEAGGFLNLSVTANGTGPLLYQWTRDGVAITGAAGASLKVTTGGTYGVTVSSAHGQASAVPVQIANPIDVGALAGEYIGLIRASDGTADAALTHASWVSAAVNRSGSMTGRILRRNGVSQAFTGRCDPLGKVVFEKGNSLAVMSGTQLIGNMTMAIASEGSVRKLAGSVASVVGGVAVEKATFEAAATRLVAASELGRYTAIFERKGLRSASEPLGSGVASFSVSAAGVNFTGKLADGSAVSFSAKVCEGGVVPIFIPLYSGRGFLAGDLKFDSSAARSDALGVGMKWHRDRGESSAGNYLAGWPGGISVDLIASKFDVTKGFGFAPTFDGRMKLQATDGGAKPLADEAVTLVRNTVLSASAQSAVKLGAKLTVSSGFVDGTFVPVGSRSAISYTSVVLQKSGYAAGFFMNNRLSGLVDLRPVAP